MSTRTLIIAAGGTGGHLFPAAAFSEAMRARGWRVVLMTDARGRKYATQFPADQIEDTPASTLAGRNSFKLALAGLKIVRGIVAARSLLKQIDPAIVAGFGGYPSLPALTAARAEGVPILIHEQNSVLGRVNRRFAVHAQAVACGFERLDRLPPAAIARKIVTGNPVRPAVLAARAAPYPPIAPGGPIQLLVIGGSQGARIFGEVIPKAVVALPQDLRMRLHITQQAREEQVEAVRRTYAGLVASADISPFFTDMGQRLANCHLMIARAGASTITELQAAGRPAILAPLAIATDDHQTGNAEALTSIGAADVVAEADFTPARVTALLAQRLSDLHALSVRAAAARASGKVDAAERLADVAEKIAAR
jgi:UDP-N-acetylglucosamine--N-acetylmuramyl-(pentapeptide) pyrophosphoryl-undecaprenol N-acetylglucosamine transferase